MATETPSDEDLLEAYARGDFAAFDAFYRRHAGLLHRVLLVRLRSRADADEALQEVFLRLHRHVHGYDRSRGGLSWVVTIARNAAIDVLRRRKPQAPLDPEALPARATAEIQLAARQELEAMLARLSPAERSLIERRLLDDEDYAALAPDHGGSPAAARQKVSRLLRRLRG